MLERSAELLAEKPSKPSVGTSSKVRTGRAHPGMLDGIRVDYYGTLDAARPDGDGERARAPHDVVKPWDKGQVKAVDKAIREGDLGLNPQVDGEIIRSPSPP
jgi:ribosome recycling factor